MSTEIAFLSLQLQGPLQSWGFDSQYNRRNTGLMPTKSAIAGMCCAALGYSRGSEKEKEFLENFGKVRMTAIAIARQNRKKELPVRRLQDYHTVGGGYDPNNPNERHNITVSADDGKPRQKNGQALAVLTHRQYLTDASFGVILEGDATLLADIASALADPKWGIWLGRKACIPTAPVIAGKKEGRNMPDCLPKKSWEDALYLLVGDKPLNSFTYQKEVATFTDGKDSLPDQPISFASERRFFAPRRVITRQIGESGSCW